MPAVPEKPSFHQKRDSKREKFADEYLGVQWAYTAERFLERAYLTTGTTAIASAGCAIAAAILECATAIEYLARKNDAS